MVENCARKLFGLIFILLSITLSHSQFTSQENDLQGYCPFGTTPLMNTQLNEPVACSTTSFLAQCPPGYTCSSDVGGLYCCSSSEFGGQNGQNPYLQSQEYGANTGAQVGYGQNGNYNPSYQQTNYGNTGYGTNYGNEYGQNSNLQTGYGANNYAQVGYGQNGNYNPQYQQQGYCPYGTTPLMNNQLNEPVACSTTGVLAQCPPGYTCSSDVAGMYCCSSSGQGGQFGQSPYLQTQGYGVNNNAQAGYGQNGNYNPSYQQTNYGNTGYGTNYGNGNQYLSDSTPYGNTGYGNNGYGNTGYGNTGYGNTGYGGSQYCPSGTVTYFAPGSRYPTSCTIGISTCPNSNTCQSASNSRYGIRGYCCSGGYNIGFAGRKKK